MVIISTSTDEVSIQAVSPLSIFGAGVAGAAAGAAAGALVAAADDEAAAEDAGAPLWAKAGAASGVPITMAASAMPANRLIPKNFIVIFPFVPMI
jgi:hypothetical protein